MHRSFMVLLLHLVSKKNVASTASRPMNTKGEMSASAAKATIASKVLKVPRQRSTTKHSRVATIKVMESAFRKVCDRQASSWQVYLPKCR